MIRPYRRDDADAVVCLALRAWEPVFASIEATLDPAVYRTFYPSGWRAHQRAAVEAALAEQTAWVAEQGDALIGFTSVVLHPDDDLGEIHMIAVDPAYQKQGVGAALTDQAVAWIREAGMALAMVETGTDPGHGPARRTYERAGFGLWPVARYFKKL
jgi:GNAT superfamily N-acetyltransferase